MLKVETWQEPDAQIYKFTIGNRERATVKLTKYDELQFSSPKSKETPVADQMLDLEVLIRRMEEQKLTHPNPSPDASDGGGE